MSVVNYQNEKLGKVEDLGVDVESGRLVQVILSTGGFVGLAVNEEDERSQATRMNQRNHSEKPRLVAPKRVQSNSTLR